MRLLYDSGLPQSLSHEAPADLALVRWEGTDVPDADFVRTAAEQGFRGVVLLGPDALAQQVLLHAARATGLVLVATATGDPMDAKRHILRNLKTIQQMVPFHHLLIVFASKVRPAPDSRGGLSPALRYETRMSTAEVLAEDRG